jgi:hypothetical protein
MRSTLKFYSSNKTLIADRRTTYSVSSSAEFVLFRNFDQQGSVSSSVTVMGASGEPVHLVSKLPYKRSFVGIANYQPATGPLLFASTIPIYVKTVLQSGEEVWIIQCDNDINGQFAFAGKVTAKGSLKPTIINDGEFSLLAFGEADGWARIKSSTSETDLVVLALTGWDLATLNPIFEDWHWTLSPDENDNPQYVFWGPYSSHFQADKKLITVENFGKVRNLYSLSSHGQNFLQSTEAKYQGLNAVYQAKVDSRGRSVSFPTIPIKPTTSRKVDFGSMDWKPLPMNSGNSKPLKDPIDYCFTSGHCLYKIEFVAHSRKQTVTLNLNVRHRATLILNNSVVGGHIVYSLGAFRAGSKNGPDSALFGGWNTYEFPADKLVIGGNNVLIVIVESFGMNRQPFALNDCRNPRGILEGKFKGVIQSKTKWSIAGVDVRKLSQVFNHTGFQDQEGNFGLVKLEAASAAVWELNVFYPSWHEAVFDYSSAAGVSHPVRMKISGEPMAFIFINGTMIGRYYGNGDGPQHDFLVQCGLLNEKNNKIKLLTYSRNQAKLVLQFDAWKMEQGPFSSGNICEDGEQFVLLQDTIAIQ